MLCYCGNMKLMLRRQAEGSWLCRVVAAWQAGRVSNLDYLLYLNLAAGRSFNDLTQWCAVLNTRSSVLS